MKFKEKSWIWKLTWPFAHNNYTVILGTIYYPRGNFPSMSIIRHEEIHEEQRKRVGNISFYFRYLFCLPILWNKFRYSCEFEAYTKGSGMSEEEAKKMLRRSTYGWLLNG